MVTETFNFSNKKPITWGQVCVTIDGSRGQIDGMGLYNGGPEGDRNCGLVIICSGYKSLHSRSGARSWGCTAQPGRHVPCLDN